MNVGHVVSKPTVSWLVPSLRSDPWLDEAVTSLLADLDSAAHPQEIIVVLDGGSLQGSERWARDPRVRTIELARRNGLPVALNHAARVARGQFLGRLDADDRAMLGRSSAQVAYLLEHPQCVAVGTGYNLISGEGMRIGTHIPTGGDRRAIMCRRNPIAHPSVMMRAEALARAGGYNESLRQMEDYDLWLRMALIGEVHVIPDAYLDYRIHDGQMSRASFPFGRYVSHVMKGRVRLARHLRTSVLNAYALNAAWWTAQVLRSVGLRNPRLRMVRATRRHESE